MEFIDTLSKRNNEPFRFYRNMQKDHKVARPLTPLYFRGGNETTFQQKKEYGVVAVFAGDHPEEHYPLMTTSLSFARDYAQANFIEVWMPNLTMIDRSWHEDPQLGHDRGYESPRIKGQKSGPELQLMAEQLIASGVSELRIFPMLKGKPLPHLPGKALVAGFRIPSQSSPFNEFLNYSFTNKTTVQLYEDWRRFNKLFKQIDIKLTDQTTNKEWLINSIYQTLYEYGVYQHCVEIGQNPTSERKRVLIDTIRHLPPLSDQHQRWIRLLADAAERRSLK